MDVIIKNKGYTSFKSQREKKPRTSENARRLRLSEALGGCCFALPSVRKLSSSILQFQWFFPRPEIGQLSPHSGAISLLTYTVNLEKRERKKNTGEIQTIQWRRRPEIWKATKEYLNQRGTKIRVFRVCFRTPFLPPFFLISPPSFPFRPCAFSHHFSPLHLPLHPPFFGSRKSPI